MYQLGSPTVAGNIASPQTSVEHGAANPNFFETGDKTRFSSISSSILSTLLDKMNYTLSVNTYSSFKNIVSVLTLTPNEICDDLVL